MSKLDSIILDYGNRMLDVANGKENPTLSELNGKPVEEIKQLFQELLDEVIGEYEMDVQELEDTPNGSFVPFMMKNDLRNEQRQRAKELLEEL